MISVLELNGELHPYIFRDIFGFSNTLAAATLDLTEQTMKSYGYRAEANGRRDPQERTLRRTWDKCRILLMTGHQPKKPELIPVELQHLIKIAA